MFYTVGEMAKILNTTPSTLRYYDKEGLQKIPAWALKISKGLSKWLLPVTAPLKNACR